MSVPQECWLHHQGRSFEKMNWSILRNIHLSMFENHTELDGWKKQQRSVRRSSHPLHTLLCWKPQQKCSCCGFLLCISLCPESVSDTFPVKTKKKKKCKKKSYDLWERVNSVTENMRDFFSFQDSVIFIASFLNLKVDMVNAVATYWWGMVLQCFD